jgi:membrane-bound serine protease (ClpP class)
VTGAGLLIAEAHLPTYGALGVAGLLALVGGSVLAIDGAGGGVVLVVVVALMIVLLGGLFLVYAGRQVLSANRSHTRTGADGLVGRVGVVRASESPLAQVFVDGALWRARLCWDPSEQLNEGDTVVVERVQGLTLGVRRAEEWELEL